MRVCFESLCFASQRPRDEDDAEATGQSQSRAHSRAGGAQAGSGSQGRSPPQQPKRTSAFVVVDSMGSVQELQALLADKEARIAELEAALRKRDDDMVQLRSHLDKFQSVFPYSYTQINNNLSAPSSPSGPPSPAAPGLTTPTGPRPRKQRAQGISAEPWNDELDLQDFPTIEKSDR
ncbi:cGMP-dependent protein kinase, isozyme 2 forms cD4/T1/T3A/T3B-like [Frankliniella occidentalis]|uniref:cGMP-dependent protein kinase, isozyme 2 forms cD4/T1/T3A/T3B-like n=1 Tax=Frankliniella occidentalis TaxID=133901 RepID=A0A9C6TYB0_FRAOC|nr:cGMP-dependent protein kinase, isozyme 2 forms cD4/T1/T3A/T3B-like [Frankliniella occidentalis]